LGLIKTITRKPLFTMSYLTILLTVVRELWQKPP